MRLAKPRSARAGKRSPLRPPQKRALAASAPPREDAAAPSVKVSRRVRGAAPEVSQKLQKLLAQAGLGSRRLMEIWIEAGRITVNGKIAGIGTRITPADHVQVDGREVRMAPAAAEQAMRVLIYHKPEGEIVTRDDPQGRETVFDRLPRLRGARWLSIGRLDVSTSGLLLFTTSGALANHMMHPRYQLEREYAARVFGRLSDAQMQQLREGVELDDGIARCAKLEDEGGEGSNHWYRLVMTEGRNRVVRRLFEAVGFTVSRLIRVRFGPVHLPPRLKRGQFVEMPVNEVKQLSAVLASQAGSTRSENTLTEKTPRREAGAKNQGVRPRFSGRGS